MTIPLDPLFARTTSDMVDRALAFAKLSHRGQVRKYHTPPVPYVEHPIRVAAEVAIWSWATKDDIVIALLHDVLEDTYVNRMDIHTQFGESVLTGVEWMTSPSKALSHMTREQRKALDRTYYSLAPQNVRRIKLLDRIDNLRDSECAPPAWRRMYAKESLDLLLALIAVNTDKVIELELADVIGEVQSQCGEQE